MGWRRAVSDGRRPVARSPEVPGTNRFAEANLRTYVRDRKRGDHGVYFFSLDASNPLAPPGALRVLVTSHVHLREAAPKEAVGSSRKRHIVLICFFDDSREFETREKLHCFTDLIAR